MRPFVAMSPLKSQSLERRVHSWNQLSLETCFRPVLLLRNPELLANVVADLDFEIFKKTEDLGAEQSSS